MRVGIVGSRRRFDRKSVEDLIESLHPDTVVVSGGCIGPDTWAATAATRKGLKVVEHLPSLPKSGAPYYEFVKAYHARNKKIVEDSDMIYAFVANDRSGGTENTIKHAIDLNIPIVLL